MNENMIFAENLSRLMKEHQYSRNTLAKALEIPYTTLTNWIKGVRHPKMEMIDKIANYFSVPKASLLEKFDPEKERLLACYDDLSLSNKEKLLEKAVTLLESQAKKKIIPLKESRIKMAEIDFYGAVSAGRGLYLQDEYREVIEVPEDEIPPLCDFALVINGDSMEPEFHDGDYVYVKKQDTLFNGTLGIFILNGEGYFKRIWFEKNRAILESLNEKYDDIVVTEDDHFSIVGKVVNV